jgi:hypothetical protein
MLSFLTSKFRCHIEARIVPLVKIHNSIKILLFQRSQTLNAGVIRQRILANLVLRLAVRRQRAETALVELLPVDGTVEVSTSADGLGKDDTGSVETLPDSIKVAASCDFLDEHGSETLASELFVNSKEVDLGAGDYVFTDTKVNGDGGDKSDKETRLSGAHTDVVLLLPTRRHHGPVRVSEN